MVANESTADSEFVLPSQCEVYVSAKSDHHFPTFNKGTYSTSLLNICPRAESVFLFLTQSGAAEYPPISGNNKAIDH